MPAILNIFVLQNSENLESLHLEGVTSMDDASRMLPLGLYTTFKTLGGRRKVLGLSTHLARLYAPAPSLGIHPAANELQLRSSLRSLLGQFEAEECRVRVSIATEKTPGQIFILIEPLKPIAPAIYRSGIQVVTAPLFRKTPKLKTTAFIQQSDAERKALLNENIREVLLVRSGRILEGMTSNFYGIINRQIVTARNGILPGVTRRVVLRIARRLGYPVVYRPIRLEELQNLTEAFITSSSRGVLSVTRIDSVPVGQGTPGEMTMRLGSSYDDYLLGHAETI